MKRVRTCLGMVGLLAWGAVSAETATGDDNAALVDFVRAAIVTSTATRGKVTRADVHERMNDSGIPAHWIRPSVPLKVGLRREQRASSFERSGLFGEVRFRSDGTLADQISRQYDDFGRSLSRTLLGDSAGENVRFKRIDDGVGISIDFH